MLAACQEITRVLLRPADVKKGKKGKKKRRFQCCGSQTRLSRGNIENTRLEEFV